jgi:hypothetical protein
MQAVPATHREGVMAIKQVYDNQTEIPQGLQEHYSDRDGRWTLVLDPPQEDVTGLKNALNQERTLRREAEKTASDMKVKFEGIEPEEVAKLRERVKGLDDSEIYDRQGIEALVLRRTESMKADHDRVMRAKDQEIGQLKSTVETTDRKWRQDRIKTALLDAVSTAGVEKKAVQDAVMRGMAVFSDLDDQGNVVARNGEEIRYGKDGVNPLTPGEWIATLKASGDASHLWPSSSGSGAQVGHGGGNSGIDYSKLPPAERMTLFREHQATQQR